MYQFELQPTLIGERLELRPLSIADFETLYLAASDPLIWEQHPFPNRYKLDEFQKFFSDALESRGALVVIHSETRKIIGTSRYYEFDRERGSVVVGYTFLERVYWGGSFNSELKRLMLDHAFKFVPTVHFHVDETNIRSQRAMQKIGGQRIGHFEKPKSGGGTRTALIYTIERTLQS